MSLIYTHSEKPSDIYENRLLDVLRLCDGTIDITTLVREVGAGATIWRHNLSMYEAEKLGVALCKDIIENYTRRDEEHAASIDKLMETISGLLREVQAHKNTIENNCAEQIYLQHELNYCRGQVEDLGSIIEERNEYKKSLQEERIDHAAERQAANKVYHSIIRDKNFAIEKLEYALANVPPIPCIDSDDIAPVYGMRSQNFKRLVTGFHGKVSRHGKTIIISIPFKHEIVAKTAVEYITGQED